RYVNIGQEQDQNQEPKQGKTPGSARQNRHAPAAAYAIMVHGFITALTNLSHSMKTATGDGADQAVLDKPTRGASAREATKPAIDTPPDETQRTVKELKIYVDGNFFAEQDAKVSV